jgi:hypothetical protein
MRAALQKVRHIPQPNVADGYGPDDTPRHDRLQGTAHTSPRASCRMVWISLGRARRRGCSPPGQRESPARRPASALAERLGSRSGFSGRRRPGPLVRARWRLRKESAIFSARSAGPAPSRLPVRATFAGSRAPANVRWLSLGAHPPVLTAARDWSCLYRGADVVQTNPEIQINAALLHSPSVRPAHGRRLPHAKPIREQRC